MKERLGDKLKTFRARAKESEPLSRDPWIKANSEIEPQKLHALGVVCFRWNLCENKLRGLFWALLSLSTEECHIIMHELGDIALMLRIGTLASIRLKKYPKLVAAIRNALETYEACRQNRNQLSHFDLVLVAQKESVTPRYRLAFARRSKAPEHRTRAPFPDSIQDIRRVARDIRRLNAVLRTLERRTVMTLKPRLKLKARDWPLPDKLPVPELLWKPPSQVPKERKPQQQPSRA